MTYIEYGKRRYVPARCPKCGQGEVRSGKSINDLFRAVYVGWKPVLRKNHWRVWRWFGHCGACVLDSYISNPASLLSRIQSGDSYSRPVVIGLIPKD